MEKYKFPCAPVANPEATVTGPQYRFTLVNPMVLRYEWAEDGIFEDRASTFAINRQFPVPEFHVEETETQLEIFTATFQVSYDKKRFSPHGLSVSFKSKVTMWGADWRYGSQPSEHNLGGTARTLDEVNGRCDMGAGILSRLGHASVDDSESMLFLEDGFVSPRRAGDRVDGYLFVYGMDYKAAMKAFFAISGPQPALPRWSLGNWWCRFYKYTADSYLALMDRFKNEAIPMSVAVIDMDWHLVRDDRVPHAGWTGYTWDRELFPDPVAFAKALHDRDLKVSLNDHPHAGVHHHEQDYEVVAKAIGHDTSKKAPILFDPTSPEFMHAFLNVLHRRLEKDGCDFWWIDWQQGPISRVPGLDPLWLLNHFQFLDHKMHSPTNNLPIIFSRYGGPGSHRYPIGFSGDTHITWDSLAFQPEFTATASNVGYGWWSHDLGGHMFGTRDDELTARWVQLGAFSPILRLHSSNSNWSGKEPWGYRRDAGDVMASCMRLRHRLVPYIYSESFRPDEPLCQPMYWSYPEREQAYQYPNQYTFGGSLVVAPIVQPRDTRTNLARVKMWVPPGKHVDVFNGTVYDGDREMDMYRPLESLPVLAPEGTIVPLDGAEVPANGCKNPESLEVLVVVGRDNHYTLVEDSRDDGDEQDQGQHCSEISWQQATGTLTATSHTSRAWTFRFVGYLDSPCCMRVTGNGSQVSEAAISVDKASGLLVSLPMMEAGTKVVVELGSEPRLSIRDFPEQISSHVQQSQIAFSDKDRIWGIVQSPRPTVVKVGELLGTGLDRDVVGPVVEYLGADGRSV